MFEVNLKCRRMLKFFFKPALKKKYPLVIHITILLTDTQELRPFNQL